MAAFRKPAGNLLINAIGIVRLTLVVLIIVAGTLPILLTGLLPVTFRGIPLPNWIASWMAWGYVRLCNIAVSAPDRRRLAQHRGVIIANHDSWLDIIVSLSVAPVRFLAKAEVRSYPFIGRIARSVGTIFVDRSDKQSRQAAREALRDTPDRPPILIFPEGGVDALQSMQPFRWGGFEIAVDREWPVLPLAIAYEPFEIARWGTWENSMLQGIWRQARFGRIHTTLIIHPPLFPAPDEEAAGLAARTRNVIEGSLRDFYINQTTV
jgi:1-acyl-sn-glycerol-3-phosphate acyltransferase